MMFTIGEVSPVSGTRIQKSNTGWLSGEIPMIWPPRAFTSWALEMIELFWSSLETRAITGVSFVIKANGPCFSSPPAKPSA